jgi:hypothetical protein
VKILILTLLTAAIVCAGPLAGPVPGYILDTRSGSLRPILGIPGAMQLGTGISLPFQITSADFDPSGTLAVVVSTETPNHLYVIQNLSNPAITDMGAIADNSSVLAVSSTGQAAVLSAPGQLQFLTGINNSAVLSSAVPTQTLLGPISAGVLDDAGQCALLGTSADTAGALETLCADGTSRRILTQPGMHISAIALANQGQDAVLADSAGQQILRVANYAQSTAVSTLAASQDGINTPVGLQVKGQQAIVADSAASSIFLIDLSGQTPIQAVALSGTPTKLKFLADRSVAVLGDPTLAPFTIFDLQAMQSFFIPTN